MGTGTGQKGGPPDPTLTFPKRGPKSAQPCWPRRLGGTNQKQRLRNSGCGERRAGGTALGGFVPGAAVHPEGAHGVTLPAATPMGLSPPSRGAQRRITAYLQHQLEAVPSLHLRGQVAGDGEESENPVVAPGGGTRQRSLRSPGAGEGSVHALLQPFGPHRLPEQPELEAVDAAAALHRLVPGVERHVVEFVSLEEVRGACPVAALQQPLWETGVKV